MVSYCSHSHSCERHRLEFTLAPRTKGPFSSTFVRFHFYGTFVWCDTVVSGRLQRPQDQDLDPGLWLLAIDRYCFLFYSLVPNKQKVCAREGKGGGMVRPPQGVNVAKCGSRRRSDSLRRYPCHRVTDHVPFISSFYKRVQCLNELLF